MKVVSNIGHIELIFGSMYCGKTEELIRRLKRLQIAGKKFILFKPLIDNRYGMNFITTHDTHLAKCEIIKNLSNYLGNDNVNVDGIDDIVDIVHRYSLQTLEAVPIKKSNEMLNKIDNFDVVGIDEIQFFDEESVNIIDKMVNMGKIVIVSGLDMYSNGEPFSIVPILACKAKYVTKLHAVCVDCGNDAYISYKLNEEDVKIDIGSTGKYVALCQNCVSERNKIKKFKKY